MPHYIVRSCGGNTSFYLLQGISRILLGLTSRLSDQIAVNNIKALGWLPNAALYVKDGIDGHALSVANQRYRDERSSATNSRLNMLFMVSSSI